MTTLRTRIIKLAHANPGALRTALLGVLKEAAPVKGPPNAKERHELRKGFAWAWEKLDEDDRRGVVKKMKVTPASLSESDVWAAVKAVDGGVGLWELDRLATKAEAKSIRDLADATGDDEDQ